MTKLCSNCLYFDPAPRQTREDQQIGYCHGNPPTARFDTIDGKLKPIIAIFPVVVDTMWCGLWEAAAND